ncbi:MAG: small multi-drug export protein [Ruminococcaceae bacterium]|nr:small multi-drug export protein [Oscillospiraceae bacterium]
MVESLVESLVGFFSGTLPKELIVFFISVVPVLELRGSILAAGFLQMDFLPTFIISVIGNMLPIPFILLFIDKIFAWLKNTRCKNLVEKLEAKALSKSDQIQKYGRVGLFLFVAIPLPGTGAWTGSLIASLLRMKMRDALPWIFLGVLTAGLIMSLLAFGIIQPLIS